MPKVHLHFYVTPTVYKESLIMQKLTRENLFTLEKYAEIRKDFKDKVIQHKKNRHDNQDTDDAE